MRGAATGRRHRLDAAVALPRATAAFALPLLSLLAVALLAAVAVLASVVAARPALAVQTTTFSLTPTDERTSIVVYAGSGNHTDHFVLHNLKHAPITVDLKVLSLTKSGGSFQAGPPGVGFAQQVRLSTGKVTLGPGQTTTLPVHIDTDYPAAGHVERFAVIDASQEAQLHSGINVVPHLQLAIELKPAQAGSGSGTSSGWSGAKIAGVAIASALALIALVAWLLAVVSRRRRTAR